MTDRHGVRRLPAQPRGATWSSRQDSQFIQLLGAFAPSCSLCDVGSGPCNDARIATCPFGYLDTIRGDVPADEGQAAILPASAYAFANDVTKMTPVAVRAHALVRVEQR
jgi:uncharacterized SAM-dependent methyltransferase